MKDLEDNVEFELKPDKFRKGSEELKRILHFAEELRRKPTDADWLRILSHIRIADDSQKEWEEAKERWNKQEKFS